MNDHTTHPAAHPAANARRALEASLYECKRVVVGQDAMLEGMQEHQVTIGGETYGVPEPFLVLATQNPIESEGTYDLPEAQVDRFLFKLVVDYPEVEDEIAVVDRVSVEAPRPRRAVEIDALFGHQQVAREVFADRSVMA